jgi:hypothetical protein
MPNFADAEYEPRLQQARVFGTSETNIQVNTAALSPSTSSSSKESASALTSSVSSASSWEIKRILGRTDPEICGFALGQGSKHETPRWEANSFFRKYVDEAKRRGFSAHSCAALFGWESAGTKQVSAETNVEKPTEIDDPQTQAKLAGATIWHTSRDGVFAFSEIGGKGNMIAVSKQVELKLILRREKWGIFEYAARGGGVGQGWISMDTVEPYK